jgi:hypothetical protein
MNELTLNELRAHERNLEEEWISKYRAALQAVPDDEPWDAHLRDIAQKFYGSATSKAQAVWANILSNKTIVRWMQIVMPGTRTAKPSPLPFSVVRTIQAIAPQRSHAVAVRRNTTKKAG